MSALIRNIVIFVCGIIFTFLLIFLGIKPILNDVDGLYTKVKLQKTEVLTLDQQILAYKTAQSDLSKADRKEEIETAIPTRETLIEAVLDLELAMNLTGNDHDLQIRDYTEATLTKPDAITSGRRGIEEIPYTLSFTNDYLSVLSALAYLEHLPHFTEISKIDLSAETVPGPENTAINTGRVFSNIQGVFFIKTEQ